MRGADNGLLPGPIPVQRALTATFCLLIIWSNRYDVPIRLGTTTAMRF